MYNLDEIRENYRGFSDSSVENIAKNESKGLRKEVLSILKDEILRRKLNPSLINWVETEAEPFEGKERDLLIQNIKSQSCSRCNNETELFGFETTTIQGLLLFTNTVKRELIICKPCGLKAKSNALAITFFAGWWSRQGILLTPFTIIKDAINFLFIAKISHRIIDTFVDEVSGTFRRYGANEKTIRRMINRKNETILK